MSAAFYNDVFGRLEWDDRLEGWRGALDWPEDRSTEIMIWPPGPDVLAGVRMAADGLDWLKPYADHARWSVAREMMDVYNEEWQDGAGPITKGEVFHQLELVRVGFVEDGSLLLTYECGNLFGEHLVEGEFGPERSFRGAGLIE
jgi:hypothetical protein